MSCLLEVRWRWQGGGLFGMEGKRYKLWWSGKGDRVGSVGVMVKEELFEAVEVRIVNVRVMVDVLVFEEDVLRLVCGYTLPSGTGLDQEQYLWCVER